MNFRIFDTPDDAVSALARTIVQRVEGKERASIALSGGSSPKPLYEMLGAAPLRDQLAKTAITWVVVDERYVPKSDPQSNAAMIERTLFAGGMSPGHDFLQFHTELNDPEKTAETFEREWTSRGVESLDVVLLGAGEDGHTASLFPGTPVLDVADRIAAAVFVPRLEQWRVTITMPVIRAAKLRIVLAAGASKQKIIAELQGGADYPVQRATGGEIETWWFVDRAAVGNME